MASRASWKGELKIGSSRIPVKLYAAVQDRDVHFHILQKKTGNRVKQQMVTEDEESVEREEIRKGYEVEPGTFVILEEPELKRLQAKPSRTIGISRFVPVSALGHAASVFAFRVRASFAISAVRRSRPFLNSALILSGLIFFGR